MLLLVGLGNPGTEYLRNRHNIGFIALDAIAEHHGFSPWRRRFQGQACEGHLGSVKVLALKPTTYMNESGRAIGEASRFYKIDPVDVVVLHDEIDLAPGKLKMKRGGGHAGHNGLRNIHAHIGADYRRIRLGVGHPGDKNRVKGFVLKDFSKTERDWLPDLFDAIAEAAPLLAAGDDPGFASKVALIRNPPEHKPKPEPKTGSAEPAESDE